MASVSSSTQTLLDQYVSAYTQTQQYRYDPYDLKAQQLEAKSQFFTQLNAKLNTLLSSIDRFGTYKNVTRVTGTEEVDDPDNPGQTITRDVTTTTREFVKANNVDDKFNLRKVTASSNDYVTASASGTAFLGTNNVKVARLATADSYIGKQLSIAKTDSGEVDSDGNAVMKGSLDAALSTIANRTAGDNKLSFKITAGGEEKDIEVAIGANDTNEDVMKNIVKAVNSTAGDKVNAAFVKDTSGTARLTFTAKDTGEDNQISFSVDSTDTENVAALALFGIETTGTREQYVDNGNGSSYGYQTADATLLNSKINLNGVTITRGSNSIADAIDGVTLTLKKVNAADDAPTSLTTEIDTSSVIKQMDNLMSSFNAISSFIIANKNTSAADSSMLSLGSTLKGLVSEDLSSFSRYYKADGDYGEDDTQPIRYLAELGFKIGTDGVLTLSDITKFEKVLKSENGAKLITDVITGFSARVSEYVDGLTARDSNQGLIKSRLSSISQQIDTNNKRITQIDQYIEKQAEATRKQYTAYLSAYYNAQNQAAYLAVLQSYSSSSNTYDSLVASQATSSSY